MLVYTVKEGKSLSEASLDEIGGMIFPQLAYCDFDLLPQITKLTDLVSDDEIKTLTQDSFGGKSTKESAKTMIKNPCLKNASWHQVISKVDVETQMQFNVVTLYVATGRYYVVHHGTTAITIGWKENFNMSFRDWVPAHYFAHSYYRKVRDRFPGKFCIGSHSKGGNLASAVTLGLKEVDLASIVRIDCFDGPGFHNQDRLKSKFLKLKGKIHKCIPQGFLVRVFQDDLIREKDYCTIVAAAGVNIPQHDMFNWCVRGGKFVTLKQLDSTSEISWGAIAEWLKNTTDAERRDFIEMLYLTVSDTNQIYLRNLLTPKTTYKLVAYLIRNSPVEKEVWEPMIRRLFQAYVNSSTTTLSR